jgi:hypothetical protein
VPFGAFEQRSNRRYGFANVFPAAFQKTQNGLMVMASPMPAQIEPSDSRLA